MSRARSRRDAGAESARGAARLFARKGVLLLFAIIVTAAIACEEAGTPPASEGGSAGPAASTTPSQPEVERAAATFPGGIVFARPIPRGAPILHSMDGAFPVEIEVTGPGFALAPEQAVTTIDDSLVVTGLDGSVRRVRVSGAVQVARPALSPDGRRVAVQAVPQGGSDLEIYVVDLDTGAAERVPGHPWNDESPEWLPSGDRIVYSSFSPEAGVNAHVFDLVAGREVLTIPEGGAIHLAVSRDGRLLLDPGRALLYDLESGMLVADLRTRIVEQARAAGFALDTRFPGQADRGLFPLDGDFSSDGQGLVFDGAVERDGEYGVIVFTMRIDGTGFELVAGPFEVDPVQSNNHNFSQLNPMWLVR